jgi:hypothetical protein
MLERFQQLTDGPCVALSVNVRQEPLPYCCGFGARREDMTVEARTARIDTQDEPAFKPNHVGTNVEALNNRSELALAGMEIMTISDWDALKLELHQKFETIGRWPLAKSKARSRSQGRCIGGIDRVVTSTFRKQSARTWRSTKEQPIAFLSRRSSNGNILDTGAGKTSTQPSRLSESVIARVSGRLMGDR